jgi:hypothetical protein
MLAQTIILIVNSLEDLRRRIVHKWRRWRIVKGEAIGPILINTIFSSIPLTKKLYTLFFFLLCFCMLWYIL